MSQDISLRAVEVALLCNVVIALIKFIAAYHTGSASLFSEGLHSTADTANSIFLLIGIWMSKKPPDREHPFGHGLNTYFWALVASIFMLGVISTGSILKGYAQITSPSLLTNLYVGYIVLIGAAVFEAVAFTAATTGLLRDVNKNGERKIKNPFKAFLISTNPSVKLIFVEDGMALFGVIFVLIALLTADLTDIHAIDGYAAITIGVVLGVLAIFLANENREMLIGMAADEGLEMKIKRIIKKNRFVKDLGGLKTQYIAPDKILVYVTIELNPHMPVEKMDDIVMDLEDTIKRKIPSISDCFIEVVGDIDEWEEKMMEE